MPVFAFFAARALLDVIRVGVAPAVMVSAAAVLILGIGQKHSELSNRVRAFTKELAEEFPTPERRESLLVQLGYFERRLGYLSKAHRALYGATTCYIAVILLLTLGGPTRFASLSLTLFVLGTVLMLGAVSLELLELGLANHAIRREMKDRVQEATPPVLVPNPP